MALLQVIEGWAFRTFRDRMREVSLLGPGPFFKATDLPVAQELEREFPAIQKEMMAILQRRKDFAHFHHLSPEQSYISNDAGWKVFFFRGLDHTFKRNAALAPETMRIINRYRRTVRSCMISVLEPGKLLNPHKGPWPWMLRMHLALAIPDEEECALVVEGEEYHWRVGQTMLFDDTFDHFAFNNTDRPRAVLFMDVLRPMPFVWTLCAEALIAVSKLWPYVLKPIWRHRQWEMAFYRD